MSKNSKNKTYVDLLEIQIELSVIKIMDRDPNLVENEIVCQ